MSRPSISWNKIIWGSPSSCVGYRGGSRWHQESLLSLLGRTPLHTVLTGIPGAIPLQWEHPHPHGHLLALDTYVIIGLLHHLVLYLLKPAVCTRTLRMTHHHDKNKFWWQNVQNNADRYCWRLHVGPPSQFLQWLRRYVWDIHREGISHLGGWWSLTLGLATPVCGVGRAGGEGLWVGHLWRVPLSAQWQCYIPIYLFCIEGTLHIC